ncbi:uncharacterized protein LOC132201724 isoform X2 [Neocloeon triangulifer]|uniref:uncharacterized protein LOC132201724 isoform X2 n=1 Tax=Neocloeon triangulifer TaxID=2078957 RepID=UPI00286ED93F|nr:uncharacterized protein LOC132201724 isoform X2 [Neocloeon triangulifer]
MEEPPGVFRVGDLDILLRPRSSTPRAPKGLQTVQSPRVPDFHVMPPHDYLPPLPPREPCVPSLAANVPFYHVPGPLADNRRNLRHAPPPGVAVEAARLSKKSTGLLCGPSTWTLSLQPTRAKGTLRWRFLAVLLLTASVSAAGGLILMLLTTLANQPIEVVTEFRLEPIVGESNEVVSVISGEFLFPRVDFVPEFHDTNSDAFKLMALQIKEKLDSLFYTSELSSCFNGSTVYAFRPSPNGEGLEVLCHLQLIITEQPMSEAEEPANRAGLAFLRGLRHHEGHMWLGKWIVDVQSIVFSGYAARGAFREHHSTAEVGWTSWGPWSVCGVGGVQTRSRKCALKNGTGVVLKSAEQCLQLGGGDLQIKDCTHSKTEAVVAVWRPPRPDRTDSEESSVRLCDECRPDEVCVALVGEPVPSCRASKDPADPTGCGGLCKINTEFCRQLDKDAFRCTDDSHCLESEWRCANKLCIPRSGRCDGHMNCYDHSDEYNCGCPRGQFRCASGECVLETLRCDGTDDCGDKSDEANCPNATTTTVSTTLNT